MKKILLFVLLAAISCKKKINKENPDENISSGSVITSEYELYKAKNQKGLLLLFPCFPCNAENTLDEFEIKDIVLKNGFSVLAMNFNERLYLTEEEKKLLAEKLIRIIQEQELTETNIFIGGFSSGGNIALLLSDYLQERQKQIRLKGVFIVDSPIDLLALYKVAQKNIAQNFSEPSVRESEWIVKTLKQSFGDPDKNLSGFETYSPYTFKTQNTDNLKNLKGLKIRFYTEPDLNWWKKNRKNDYEDLNAFYIKKLSENLKAEFGESHMELIETQNKGFRKNGKRHPHSWSIVDKTELINWMQE